MSSFAPKTVAKSQKRGLDRCRCTHLRSQHLPMGDGTVGCHHGWFIYKDGRRISAPDGCPCFKFRKAPSKTRGSRRSVKKYAGQAERDVAQAMNGRRVRNQGTKHGDIDVTTETAVIQVKNYAFPNWFRRGLDQIIIGGVGTGKRRLLVVKDKPGPGRKGQTVVCELIEDWVAYNGELEVDMARTPSESADSSDRTDG